MIKRLAAIAALTLTATPAFAHTGAGAHASFFAGITHPLFGLDHVLAMVAVGLWAAQTGGKALWAWPLAFVSVMLVGGTLGMAGFALPMVEPGILVSIVVLGLMVGFAVKLPTAAGAALVGMFALLHGHAHGTELAGGTALTYAAGFALATMALHLTGLGAGLLANRRFSGIALRLAGAATAALGLGLAFAV